MRGGLRERKPGVWEVRAEAGRDPVTGRRRQVSRSVRGTKRDAEKVLNKLLADSDLGHHTGTDAKFDELAREWLAMAETDLSPSTLRRYRFILNNRVLPALGGRPVRSIRTVELDRLYLGLTNDVGLAPATVRQVHAVIRRALQQAVRWGWITSNPAANAKPSRVPKADVAPPTAEQVVQLIAKANETDPQLARFLHIAATTGARRGELCELCALRWSHVDVPSRTVTISRSIAEVKGGLIEKDTKTHAARRIALDAGTLDVIEEQRTAALGLARQAELELPDSAYVFSPEPDASVPMTPGTITKGFETLRGSLDLDAVRLHDLRHFAATRLIAAGVPVRTVSGRLGHANASTTLTVYAHFLEASDQAAAEITGNLVAPNEPT